MNSINKIARTAGLLYLLYVITSVIANLFGKFVFVEAPVTVNHIMTHAFQFRIGFVINLFSVVFFLLAAWALYVLLKPVNKDLALLFLLFNAGRFCCLVIQFTLPVCQPGDLERGRNHQSVPARSTAGAGSVFCQFIQKWGLYRPGTLWRLALSPRLSGSKIGLSSKDPRDAVDRGWHLSIRICLPAFDLP